MLKTYLYSFLFLTNIAFAQNVIKDVVASAGQEISANNISLNQTIGETVTSTINNNGITLTQGFQQTYKQTLTQEQIQKNEISIYPNPTTGAFKLKTSLLNADYRLYNVLGQRVHIKGSLKAGITKLIDLSNLQDGVYLLKVNLDEDTFRTYKIIKKK